MKIYEFTYQDKLNLTDEFLTARVSELLFVESDKQGWAHDFTFKQSSAPQKREAYTEYQFEVFGRYLATNSVDLNEDFSSPVQSTPAVAAAEQSIQ